MKKLPLGISTFREIIHEDYLYIDKTQDIYKLLKNTKYTFLSRPRRFGKTLLISTLEEIFLGNKELFQNLWIYKNTDYEWNKYPIIKLDFSNLDSLNSNTFEASLCFTLDRIAKNYNIDISLYNSSIDKIKFLIEEISDIERVVILIDEYDQPILKNLNNLEIADKIKERLQSFFTALKALDAYIYKFFITGVTKIAKTSVFSGMNQVNDISLDGPFGTILGYTKEELESYFGSYIEQAALTLNLSAQELNHKIKSEYNGYSFSDLLIKVYNPFSILYFFNKQKFDNYWFATGTPTFLITLVKSQIESVGDFGDLNNIKLSSDSLSAFELHKIPLETALFQTGYLTIIEYDKSTGIYTLSMPNEEVRNSLEITLFAIMKAVKVKNRQMFQ